MDDFERYGDYNEYEDDIPKKKSKVGLVLKILIAVVCVTVIGLFAFRMIMFNYYPDTMKNIYFTDTLKEYYYATDGDIGAKTQELKAPYDKEQGATFFADNLIVIEGIGEVQMSIRFLKSLRDDIEEQWGISIADDVEDTFTFALFRNNPSYDSSRPQDEVNTPFLPIGENTVAFSDDSITYEYIKLVFDGVDLNGVKWLSLAIYVNGVEMDEPYRIAVYENHEDYSSFDDYKLSNKEKP